jgi:hypothetical protein
MVLYGWGLVALLVICCAAIMTVQLGPLGLIFYVLATFAVGGTIAVVSAGPAHE